MQNCLKGQKLGLKISIIESFIKNESIFTDFDLNIDIHENQSEIFANIFHKFASNIVLQHSMLWCVKRGCVNHENQCFENSKISVSKQCEISVQNVGDISRICLSHCHKFICIFDLLCSGKFEN